MRIGINLYGLQDWFGGDFSSVIELVRLADQKGIDFVSLAEHVVMSENLQHYPYGEYPGGPDGAWFEPIAVLAAIAGSTHRIRLTTGILIGALRPAVLLAKQLATLDVISRGRVTIGLGVGWQKEEYDAAGVPWENRYSRLEEQVKVCRQLWREAPATFHGRTVQYDRIYSLPAPTHKDGIPIWLGLAPTDRNIQRIAEYGDGWIPMEEDPAKLKVAIDRLKAEFRVQGRDPSTLGVRGSPKMEFRADGAPDLGRTLANIPALIDAGVTDVEFSPVSFCSGPEELEAFYERILEAKVQ